MSESGLSAIAVTLKERLDSWLPSTCWPFSPDPVSPGFAGDGPNRPEAPVWLTGNSRHEVAGLRREADLTTLCLAVVDTGGRTLLEAAREGLTLEDVAERLDSLTSDEVTPGPTLLPYRVWAALGESDTFTPRGWSVIGGPASFGHLAAFWRHRQVNPGWQEPQPDYLECFHAFAAHGALLALLAAGPLLLLGRWHGIVGLALIGLAVILAAPVSWLARQSPARRRVALPVLCGLVAALSAIVSRQEIQVAISIGLAAAAVGGWLGLVVSRGRYVHAWSASPEFTRRRREGGDEPALRASAEQANWPEKLDGLGLSREPE